LKTVMKKIINKFRLSDINYYSLNTKTAIIYMSLALLIILIVTSLIFENQSDLIVRNSILKAERKVYMIDHEIFYLMEHAKKNNIKYLSDQIHKIFIENEIPKYTLFDETGNIIKIFPESNSLKQAGKEEFTNINRSIFKNENEGKLFYAEIKKTAVELRAEKEIIFYKPFTSNFQNTFVIKFPVAIMDIEYQMNILYKQCILLIIGMVLLVAVIALIYSRIVIQPVKMISDASSKVANGDYKVQLNIKSNDEIGILSDSFNKMVSSLEITTGELKNTIFELDEQNRLIQHELDVAKIIQEGMLPKVVKHGQVKFSAYYKALEKISGDYYDLIELPDGSIGIIIADVSGHGIHAALITIMAKFLFNSHGSSYISPADLLSKMNYEISATVKTGDYVSAFYLIIDPDNLVKFANAGHHSMLLYRENGEFEELNEKGTFLGLIENFPVPLNVREAKLRDGDRLILYTDGITEQLNHKGSYYGEDRLKKSIQENISLSIEKLLSSIIDDLNSFSEGYKQIDDHTLLILEIGRESQAP